MLLFREATLLCMQAKRGVRAPISAGTGSLSWKHTLEYRISSGTRDADAKRARNVRLDNQPGPGARRCWSLRSVALQSATMQSPNARLFSAARLCPSARVAAPDSAATDATSAAAVPPPIQDAAAVAAAVMPPAPGGHRRHFVHLLYTTYAGFLQHFLLGLALREAHAPSAVHKCTTCNSLPALFLRHGTATAATALLVPPLCIETISSASCICTLFGRTTTMCAARANRARVVEKPADRSRHRCRCRRRSMFQSWPFSSAGCTLPFLEADAAQCP